MTQKIYFKQGIFLLAIILFFSFQTAANQYGSIRVETDPSGMDVFLDDEYKGQTPTTISNVPVGTHTVKCTKPGYKNCVWTVTVDPGEMIKVFCAQTPGLYLYSSPSGAYVYLDGVYKGQTPVKISNVPVGTHTVKFTKPGYDDCVETVTVYSNE
ncbi:MAG: PEGA domain-containing protein, partial [Candidatus Altarchaeaceae archaeon]